MALRSLCLATLVAVTEADCSTTCRMHQPCWPSRAEVKALHDALDPKATRSLHWNGRGTPLPAPTPLGSNQPLFGSNQHLKPLYEQSHYASSTNGSVDSVYSRQATRNHPMKGEEPAFVAWPLNNDHVQKLLRFARDHNLGVSVAGTGHDFLNRHSCDQGIMIRTSLMKGIEWRLNGTDGGSVWVGPGVNFGEIMFSGKDQHPPSHTVAGWVGTVGVVGWALGGGHGPFGRSRGFGSENVLALDVVTADGELVIASAESHPDLFWAMRGGGGSTWGVVTAVTFKAYTSPPGVALAIIVASGNACKKGLEGYAHVAHGWANWTAELGPRFSGMFNVEIIPTPDPTACFGSWQHYMIYAFEGKHNDEELHSELKRLTSSFDKNLNPSWRVTPPFVEPLSHWWNYERETRSVDKIFTTPFKAKNVDFDPKEVASVAVAGEKRELMASKLVSAGKDHFSQHHYGSFMVYHDIPGLACPARPRPPPNSTALGREFRDADFHLILGRSMNHNTRDFWSELGSGAYFGESAYGMEDWKQQYWGDHYDNLLQVKRQYDPTNLFWCHDCVGSDLPRAVQEFRVQGNEVSV